MSILAEKLSLTKQVVFYACLQEETFLDGCEISTKTSQTMSEIVTALQKVRDSLRVSENEKGRLTKAVENMRSIVRCYLEG